MKKSAEVKKYIKAINDFLVARYGEVSPEWALQINLLETNLTMKEAVDNSIEDKGILIPDRFGALQKNPLIKTSIELQTKIQKCIEELGVSPKSLGHLKNVDDSDTAEILQNLMS